MSKIVPNIQPTALCGAVGVEETSGLYEMPNAVSANENGYAQRWD